MIVRNNEQILTIHEAPYEDDAFEYAYWWCEDIIFWRGNAVQGDQEWEKQRKVPKSQWKNLDEEAGQVVLCD